MLALSGAALAQATATTSVADKRAKLEQLIKAPAPAPKADPMAPELGDAAAQGDAKTREKYFEAMREYYAYRIAGLQHRRLVFAWQLTSSKLIFVTVLVLVLAGIYFAAVQFHTGIREKRVEVASELAVSADGLKVTSPVLGVIILVLSLAFFYCYLVFVYPIADIF
jgi:hypothetical protein